MQVQGATLPSSLVELRFLGGHAYAWENVYPCGPQDWTGRAPQRIVEPPGVPIAEVEAVVDSGGEEQGRGQLCAHPGSGSRWGQWQGVLLFLGLASLWERDVWRLLQGS